MSERPTTFRYRIVAWLTIAAALSYLCRNSVGVAESTIRQHLGLTLEQSGWFMAAFYWSYALMQIPTGWVAFRYGTRISLAIFAFAWSISMLGIGLAPGLVTLVVAQLLMGVAQSGIFSAACNSIGNWLPISQRSLSNGFLAGGMQVGAILAASLTGILLTKMDWRVVFAIYSIPGIIWSIAFYLRFRDRPEQVARLNPAELELIRSGRPASQQEENADSPRESSSTIWMAILSSAPVWWLIGQQLCRSSGYMFFASWFPTFLQQTRGVSVATSGYMQCFVLAGTLTGSLLGGYLSDWVWKRTGSLWLSRCGIGAFAMGVCGMLILGAWFIENAVLAIILLALGSMFAAFAAPCLFSAVIEIGGTRTPQVFALVNMSGNLAAAACPVLIGMLFNYTNNWNLVLVIFATVYVCGAICWLLVNPKRQREPEKTVVGVPAASTT